MSGVEAGGVVIGVTKDTIYVFECINCSYLLDIKLGDVNNNSEIICTNCWHKIKASVFKPLLG